MKVGLRGRVGADSEVVVGKSLGSKLRTRAAAFPTSHVSSDHNIARPPRAVPGLDPTSTLRPQLPPSGSVRPAGQSSADRTLFTQVSRLGSPLVKRPSLFYLLLLLYSRRVARIDEVFQPRRLAVKINSGHAVVCIGVL